MLSGTGLDAASPAHATSLAWIDDHAVRFFLTGGYAKSGTVTVSIPQGSIAATTGATLVGFSDTFQLGATQDPAPLPPTEPVATTAPVTPTTLISNVLPVVQPVAAAAPVAALVQPVTPASPSHPAHKPTAKEAEAAGRRGQGPQGRRGQGGEGRRAAGREARQGRPQGEEGEVTRVGLA